jgi:hypothetical protein
LLAGTIVASTHLPLRLWFRAIYHLTQTKQGISSIELGHRLEVTQTTAWKVKHKLKQVMLERDATKRLTGRVEIDDVYLGGEQCRRQAGSRGSWQDTVRRRGRDDRRGQAGSTEVTSGHQLLCIGDFRLRQAKPRPDLLCRDGLQCFGSVADARCYLAEFEYRFNRRYDLAAMIPRLIWAAVRITPNALSAPEIG